MRGGVAWTCIDSRDVILPCVEPNCICLCQELGLSQDVRVVQCHLISTLIFLRQSCLNGPVIVPNCISFVKDSNCARKILHEQESSPCLEAAAKGKSGKFSKPISHISERAGFLGR